MYKRGTEERIEWLHATIRVFKNKLSKGVYSPSQFIYAIKIYEKELADLESRV